MISNPNPVRFPVGVTPEGQTVYYDSTVSNNFHTLLLGNSGSGKTYCIQNIISHLVTQGVTVIALDTQGDMVYENFPSNCRSMIDDRQFKYIEFDYLNAKAGINPIELIRTGDNSDYQFALYNSVHAITLFNNDLGTHQESLLLTLMQELYFKFGILRDTPETWNRPSPELNDLLTLVNDKLRSITSGIDYDIFENMSSLRKDMKRKYNKSDPEFEDARDALVKKFEIFVEKDLLCDDQERVDNLGSKSRLQSIQSVLKKMVDSRLFEGGKLNISPGKINVFNIKSIHPSQYRILFDLILYRSFQSAVRSSGSNLNPNRPRIVLVFDEGKLFSIAANNPMSPINRIATEGRKYGLGSLIGIQNPDQISSEMKSAIGSTFILPVVKNDVGKVKRLWMIPSEKQALLQAKRDALVSIGSSRFELVHVFPGGY